MTTEKQPIRLGVAIGLALAIFLIGAFLFRQEGVNRSLADQSRSLLFARAKSIKPEIVPPLASFQRALFYQPLNPRLLSGALYVRSHAAKRAEVFAQGEGVLEGLGWRDTVAIQNRLFAAVQKRDVLQALDLADSLLRRDQLTAEMTPLLNAMETMPEARAEIVRRLAKLPPWREAYLSNVSALKTAPLLEGRYRLLMALQDDSTKLSVSELAPSVNQIANAGKIAEASQLWRRHVGKTKGSSILLDGNFARFGESDFGERVGVPFEWYTSTGAGFSVTAIEGADSTDVEIRWDGRRSPLFLNQIVSARPGSYRLIVRVAESPSTAQQMLEFSADCVKGGRNVFKFARTIDRQRLEYLSDGPIACPDFRFSVRGDIAPRDLSSVRSRSVPVMPVSRVTSLSELVLVPAR